MFYNLKDGNYFSIKYYAELGKATPGLGPMKPQASYAIDNHVQRWTNCVSPLHSLTIKASCGYTCISKEQKWEEITLQDLKKVFLKSNVRIREQLEPYLDGDLIKKERYYYSESNDMFFRKWKDKDQFGESTGVSFTKAYEVKSGAKRVKLSNRDSRGVHKRGVKVSPEDFLNEIIEANNAIWKEIFEERFVEFRDVDFDKIEARKSKNIKPKLV